MLAITISPLDIFFFAHFSWNVYTYDGTSILVSFYCVSSTYLKHNLHLQLLLKQPFRNKTVHHFFLLLSMSSNCSTNASFTHIFLLIFLLKSLDFCFHRSYRGIFQWNRSSMRSHLSSRLKASPSSSSIPSLNSHFPIFLAPSPTLYFDQGSNLSLIHISEPTRPY